MVSDLSGTPTAPLKLPSASIPAETIEMASNTD